MTKIKKHQLCPCGSEKIYMECCGKVRSLDAYREQLIEQETEELLNRIYDRFGMEWAEQIPLLLIEQVGDSMDRLPWLSLTVEELQEELLTEAEEEDLMILIDCILFDYLLPDGDTILEKYYEREKRQLRPVVAEICQQWTDSFVSVYRITQYLPDEGKAILVDLFYDKEYMITTQELFLSEEEEGDLLITRLLSRGESYVVSGFILFSGLSKDTLIDEITQIKNVKVAQGLITDDWKDFLKTFGYELYISAMAIGEALLEESLTDGMIEEMVDQLDWLQPSHQEVAKMICVSLSEEFSPIDIGKAVVLWHKYCESINPRIKKAEVMVALMEYILNNILQRDVSQSAIASKYGVSASSISSRLGALHTLIENTIGDDFPLF